MRENVIKNKFYAFALKIVEMYKMMTGDRKEYVLTKQIFRSGTAIEALVAESENAQSKADFVYKLNIALKETDEMRYWLNLLTDSDYIERGMFDAMIKDCNELFAILVSIMKTSKMRIKN